MSAQTGKRQKKCNMGQTSFCHRPEVKTERKRGGQPGQITDAMIFPFLILTWSDKDKIEACYSNRGGMIMKRRQGRKKDCALKDPWKTHVTVCIDLPKMNC